MSEHHHLTRAREYAVLAAARIEFWQPTVDLRVQP